MENLDFFAKSSVRSMWQDEHKVLKSDINPNWIEKCSIVLVSVIYFCGIFFITQQPTAALVTCCIWVCVHFLFGVGTARYHSAPVRCCSNHVCIYGCARLRQSGGRPKYQTPQFSQCTGCSNKGYNFSFQFLLALCCTRINELKSLYSLCQDTAE